MKYHDDQFPELECLKSIAYVSSLGRGLLLNSLKESIQVLYENVNRKKMTAEQEKAFIYEEVLFKVDIQFKEFELEEILSVVAEVFPNLSIDDLAQYIKAHTKRNDIVFGEKEKIEMNLDKISNRISQIDEQLTSENLTPSERERLEGFKSKLVEPQAGFVTLCKEYDKRLPYLLRGTLKDRETKRKIMIYDNDYYQELEYLKSIAYVDLGYHAFLLNSLRNNMRFLHEDVNRKEMTVEQEKAFIYEEVLLNVDIGFRKCGLYEILSVVAEVFPNLSIDDLAQYIKAHTKRNDIVFGEKIKAEMNLDKISNRISQIDEQLTSENLTPSERKQLEGFKSKLVELQAGFHTLCKKFDKRLPYLLRGTLKDRETKRKQKYKIDKRQAQIEAKIKAVEDENRLYNYKQEMKRQRERSEAIKEIKKMLLQNRNPDHFDDGDITAAAIQIYDEDKRLTRWVTAIEFQIEDYFRYNSEEYQNDEQDDGDRNRY